MRVIDACSARREAVAGRGHRRPRHQHRDEDDRAADHLQARHRFAEHPPGEKRGKGRLRQDHQRDQTDRRRPTATDVSPWPMRARRRRAGRRSSSRAGSRGSSSRRATARRWSRRRPTPRPTTASRRSVELGAQHFDDQQIAGVGGRRRKREGVAVADLGRRRPCPPSPRRRCSASASASQTRQGGCSAKNIAPPITARIGATLPMKVAFATLVPLIAIWNEPTSMAKARPAKHQRNGDPTKIGRLRPAASGNSRPDRERGHREAHAPGRARKRADIEKAHQDARPGDDRGSCKKGDHADTVDRRNPARRLRLDFGVHGRCAIQFVEASASLRAADLRSLYHGKRR